MVRCESCGVKNPDRATYCLNCGSELDKGADEVRCGDCGVSNPDSATYCLNCGGELTDGGDFSGEVGTQDWSDIRGDGTGTEYYGDPDKAGSGKIGKELSDLSESEIRNVSGGELVELVRDRVRRCEKTIETFEEALEAAREIGECPPEMDCRDECNAPLDESQLPNREIKVQWSGPGCESRMNHLVTVAVKMVGLGLNRKAVEVIKNLPDRHLVYGEMDYSVFLSERADGLYSLISATKGKNLEKNIVNILERYLRVAQNIHSNREKARLQRDISSTMAEYGHAQKALDVAKNISNYYYRARALRDISSTMAENGQIQKANRILDETLDAAKNISNDYYRAGALRDISSIMCENGQVQKANKILDEALDVAKNISDDSKRERALQDISSTMAENGQIQKALDVAKNISDDSKREKALRDISSILAEDGQVRKALDVAKNISDDRRRVRALKDISSTMVENGQVQKALDVAKNISDDSKREKALQDISSILAEDGQVRKALDVTKNISRDDWRRASALREISSTMAENGRVQKALDVAKNISHDGKRAGAFKDISSKLTEGGQIQKALDVAKNISDDSKRALALRDISSTMTENGQIQKADKILDEALQAAKNISDDGRRAEALKDISSTLADNGQIQKALNIAKSISDYWNREDALQDICSTMADNGQIQKALDVAKSISNGEYKAKALSSIAKSIGVSSPTPSSLPDNFTDDLEKVKQNSLHRHEDIDNRLRKLALEIKREEQEDRIEQTASSLSERIPISKSVQDLLVRYNQLHGKIDLSGLSKELDDLEEKAKKGDLKTIEGKVDRLKDEVEKTVEKAEPQLEIEVKSKSNGVSLKKGTWTDLPVLVENKGDERAEEVKLELKDSKKWDHLGTHEISSLGMGEEEKVEMKVLPTSEGDISLEMKMSCKGCVDGEVYEERCEEKVNVEG